MVNITLPSILKKISLCSLVIFCSYGLLYGQQSQQKIESGRGDLIRFAKQHGERWTLEKQRADSLAGILQMPVSFTDKTGRVTILQRLGYRNKPVYYATDNLNAASVISVDQLWSGNYGLPSLDGEGTEVNIWDGGSILKNHQEFQDAGESRITMRDINIQLSNHSTHIAGTIGAAGINPDARGMAGKTTIYGWDMNNDIAEMSMVAVDGAFVSNHSYGPLCGWYYNSSTDDWYWYGDVTISAVEDYEFGLYDQASADLDYVAWSAPGYLIVKSAGNDRNDVPAEQPVTHYVWNELWMLVSNVVRDPDGGIDGYDCLSPMAVAKNILTVGAVDDEKEMTSFSAYGPTDDGRIKPDVTANGKEVYSSYGTATDAYAYYDGTSMATASATGAIALVHNLQEKVQPGVKLQSSTIKGLLIHTADESGTSPGPDYRFGWGILNLKTACDLIFNNAGNGGKNISEGIITQGETIIIPVESDANAPFLKVTICWTDPPGVPSDPALNSRDPKLVNDIDIELENTGNQNKYYPWVLDVENPGLPAAQGINHVDNVEQIYIPNPGTGNFNLKISHTGNLSGEAQEYSLVISGISTLPGLVPPWGLKGISDESSVLLKWNHPEPGVPIHYNVYRDGVYLAQAADTLYFDSNVITNEFYEYYVTAVYEVNNEEVESVGTNCITAFPRTIMPLPFIEDFEEMPAHVLIKNDVEGWRWGNNESLESYYLHFEANTTNFIGIDSYSAGQLVHVTDVAETMPLRLAEYSDVTVSFDYLLNTDIYDAIDELHLVYKLPGDEEWTDWENLPRSYLISGHWATYTTFSLPEEAYMNGTRIGFYFDDFYTWGLGAGLDNIVVEGKPLRSVDFAISSMVSPVSSCTLSENEPVVVAIKNAGSQPALPGDIINIRVALSTGVTINDIIVLKDALPVPEIFNYTMSSNLNLSMPGTYILNITISSNIDHNTLNNSLQSTIEVSGIPSPEILNQDTEFCEDDAPVEVDVSPGGGVLSGPGISGLYFDPAVAGQGDHTVTYTYTDPSGCVGAVSQLFTVNLLPEPEILNQDIEFCGDDAPVEVDVSPEGGVLSGSGISGLNFSPASAEEGVHTITYIYTDGNGCTASVSEQFTVNALPQPAILNQDLVFCEDESPVTVEVSPAGGILSGPGISGLNFSPASAGEGVHTITYIYTDGNGCTGSVSEQFTVNALPQPAILNQDLSFCEDESPVTVEVSPAGGMLSGPGISGFSFDPSSAGPGDHNVTYTYTDPNGCVGVVSQLFRVNPLPEPAILNQDLSFCEDEEPVMIEVSPAGGTLSGTGITGQDFNPVLAGVGIHAISYYYIDENGCDAQEEILLTVNASPEVSIGPDLNLYLGETYKIEAAGTGTSFEWFDGSVASSLEVVTDAWGLGQFDIWVTAYSVDNCSSTDSLELVIDQTTDTGEESDKRGISIYPNPFKNGFFIKTGEGEEAEKITVYSTGGIKILEKSPAGDPWIDLSYLPSGTYIVIVKTGSHSAVLRAVKL